MAFLKFLGAAFLFPGTLVLGAFNITEEPDGGVFRSLINMIFWGVVCVFVTLPIVIKSVS
ncbi:MAG: hypothetical protein ACSHXY_02535 [Alphaproteobacteria bacterium]